MQNSIIEKPNVSLFIEGLIIAIAFFLLIPNETVSAWTGLPPTCATHTSNYIDESDRIDIVNKIYQITGMKLKFSDAAYLVGQNNSSNQYIITIVPKNYNTSTQAFDINGVANQYGLLFDRQSINSGDYGMRTGNSLHFKYTRQRRSTQNGSLITLYNQPPNITGQAASGYYECVDSAKNAIYRQNPNDSTLYWNIAKFPDNYTIPDLPETGGTGGTIDTTGLLTTDSAIDIGTKGLAVLLTGFIVYFIVKQFRWRSYD